MTRCDRCSSGYVLSFQPYHCDSLNYSISVASADAGCFCGGIKSLYQTCQMCHLGWKLYQTDPDRVTKSPNAYWLMFHESTTTHMKLNCVPFKIVQAEASRLLCQRACWCCWSLLLEFFCGLRRYDLNLVVGKTSLPAHKAEAPCTESQFKWNDRVGVWLSITSMYKRFWSRFKTMHTDILF